MTKTRSILLMLILPLVGCSPATIRPPAPPAGQADLSSSPEFAALAYMIEMHASFSEAERKYYTAYVVPESPLGDALVKAFPNHMPRVSNSINVDTASGEARDSATGQRVKLWDATLAERNGDRAVVSVSWYSASLAAGVHRVELALKDGKWIVLGEKMIGVS